MITWIKFATASKVAIIIVLTVCTVKITGCSSWIKPSSQSLPTLHARTLLLDLQPFPKGWEIIPCAAPCERIEQPTESARGFIHPGIPGKVLQDVYVFEQANAAQALFQRHSTIELSGLEPPDTTLLPVTRVGYQSPLADEFVFGCGMDAGVPICRAYARYRNYVVKFYFHLNPSQPSGLHIDDIEPILRATDARVAEVFRLNPIRPTPQR
jgi:hypothetical protein